MWRGGCGHSAKACGAAQARRLADQCAGNHEQSSVCVTQRLSSSRAFFCFVMGASPSVVEPAVMVWTITVRSGRLEPAVMGPSMTIELNPTLPKTGGDGNFEPAVIWGVGVVIVDVAIFFYRFD